jgi:hypothetical protein
VIYSFQPDGFARHSEHDATGFILRDCPDAGGFREALLAASPPAISAFSDSRDMLFLIPLGSRIAALPMR